KRLEFGRVAFGPIGGSYQVDLIVFLSFKAANELLQRGDSSGLERRLLVRERDEAALALGRVPGIRGLRLRLVRFPFFLFFGLLLGFLLRFLLRLRLRPRLLLGGLALRLFLGARLALGVRALLLGGFPPLLFHAPRLVRRRRALDLSDAEPR